MERGRADETMSDSALEAPATKKAASGSRSLGSGPGAGGGGGGGAAATASDQHHHHLASYDTKFAGTALQHASEMQVRLVFADNETLQVLPESKMYAEVLSPCGNIAAGTRVRIRRTLVDAMKRCGFCNAEMPDVSTTCMLCGQSAD